MTFVVRNTQAYLTQEARRYLAENDCQLGNVEWDDLSEDEMCQVIPGVEATIAGGEPYTRKVFEAAGKLKIVARTGTGYDKIDVAAATEHGVWVTNTPGDSGPAEAVADFAIGLILCLLRNICGLAHDMKQGQWKPFRGRELGGLVLGIIGTGSIGRGVIKRARAFGARVLAHDVRPDEDFAAEWQIEYVPLDDLMARSDVVSIHALLDESTRGLVDEHRLGLMKETAYLVNTSRGPLVDKAALLRVLQAKRIAGAALDVHDPTPCAPDDPLVQLDNVLATPHTAYNTEETVARMSITAARDVVAVLQGRSPVHPLNEVPVHGNSQAP